MANSIELLRQLVIGWNENADEMAKSEERMRGIPVLASAKQAAALTFRECARIPEEALDEVEGGAPCSAEQSEPGSGAKVGPSTAAGEAQECARQDREQLAHFEELFEAVGPDLTDAVDDMFTRYHAFGGKAGA